LDVRVLLDEGLRLAGTGDINGALARFEQVINGNQQDRTTETAYFESAMLLLHKLNRVDESMQRFETYLSLFKNGAYAEEALTELIKTSRSQNNPDNIIRFEGEYLGRFANKADAPDFRYEAATLCREKKVFAAAADHYNKFIEAYPADSRVEDAYFWLGKSLLEQKQNKEAQSVFKRYLQKYPQGRWVEDIQKINP
jgi:TolA-binding protein